MDVSRVALLSLEIMNTLIHTVGCYLLLVLHRSAPQDRRTTQTVFILNLAFSEFIWNLAASIRDFVKVFRLLGYNINNLNMAFSCIDRFLGI